MSLLTPSSDTLRVPALDLAEGGQNGILQSPFQWTSNANYVRSNKLLAVLVQAPGLIKYMNNPEGQLASLKSLIQLLPQSIDGLNSSVTWEYDGPAVGHAGEKFEAAVKATRATSAPNFTWNEKYGQAITRFWTEYGLQIILDPDLGTPGIVSSPAYIAANSPAILPELQAMTVLFIDHDITMTNVVNSWLCTNMMPRSAGEIVGKREMGSSGEIVQVSVEFTAFTLVGKAVNSLAKNYLNSLKLTDMRPLELKPYFEAISPDVSNVDIGLAEQLSSAVLAV
jgi:hypothetical protein